MSIASVERMVHAKMSLPVPPSLAARLLDAEATAHPQPKDTFSDLAPLYGASIIVVQQT
ncbi:hypothetical protein SAMN05216360_11258 [Methylobacterium phyllostachyos]|uniref:Uncharacterized protein n=1 Tax=Methylobacterium phyllostachyos TaxID=582672 RepID=A0A1H0EYT1_9HYPH|nr:hypothetical protein [Methylobacterium phyllostachyos]SDN87540.1 hypothetical protein SAMN05216360_11258 [Methylobacterium phyllostachyos]